MEISVIIPTYAKRSYKTTLKSLKNQEFSGKFEILIIRNGSNKNTISIEDNLVIINIKKLGANIARNLGIKKSKAKIVAFIDDDVIVAKDWLEKTYEAHKEFDCPAIGGKVLPKWPSSGKPDWVKGVLLEYLSLLDPSPLPSVVNRWGWIVGANMSFKKNVFAKVGVFDNSLDRIGENMLSCGETELCDRIRSAGMDIYYNPRIIVKHIISKERLTPSFFLQRAFWQGISDHYVDKKVMSVKKLEKKTHKHKAMLKNRKKFYTDKYLLVKEMCFVMRSLGYIHAQINTQRIAK